MALGSEYAEGVALGTRARVLDGPRAAGRLGCCSESSRPLVSIRRLLVSVRTGDFDPSGGF